MNRLSYVLSVLSLSLVTVAPQAQEMSDSRVTFGIGGGVSVPIGEFGDGAKTGFHGQAMVGFMVPGVPVEMRGEFMYHSFDGKDGGTFNPSGSGPDTRVIAGAVNGLWQLSGNEDGSNSGTQNIYIMGGVGLYNVDLDFGSASTATSDSETKFGLNVGGGLKFNLVGLDTFVEARFHNVFTDGDALRMIPITVGLMFGGPR